MPAYTPLRHAQSERRTNLAVAGLLSIPFGAVVIALSVLRTFDPPRFDIAPISPFGIPESAAIARPQPFDSAAVYEGPSQPALSHALATAARPVHPAASVSALPISLWESAATEAPPAATPATPDPDAQSEGYCSPAGAEKSTASGIQTNSELPFGDRLADAALSQTHDFVVYNDMYQSIAYPMGDVLFLYGVCTDVVVRAYRALGIDLQKLVYESGLGHRDRSIDHRRTNVLKLFFQKNGEALPLSLNPADYKAGDIVTYYRPNNRGIRAHIAIVSRQKGASNAPMIIHNQGDGPELQDALFSDPITGHFRYSGEIRTIAENPEMRGVKKHAR